MRSLFYLPVVLVLSLFFISCSNPGRNRDADKYYNEAGKFYSENKLDSAFMMFSLYVNNTNDTLTKGSVYRYMGDMTWNVGDIYAAEEYATGAIRTLDPLNEKHHSELGYAYHILGNVYLDAKHYDEALKMFDKAASFSTNTNDMITSINSKALTLQKKGEFNKAASIYDSILLLKPANQSDLARIIDNRAKTKWLQKSDYYALPEFWYALKIRTDSLDDRGLNASYAHLADYYLKIDPDSALWYAQKMFKQAQIIQTPEDRLEALDKMIRLSDATSAKQLYNQYKQLNDSTQFARDTTRNRYAFIRYDSQKNKVENLQLKADKRLQELWIFALIAIAISAITWLRYRYNKRRKRMKQEADDAIRESKLKTSRKVHDVVANGLYVIMNELEHGNSIDKEPLMTKIEGLYERSRNISYEDDSPQPPGPAFDSRIQDLLTGFASEQTKVIAVGNEPAFWSKITATQKHELELVLNELLVNMKKHSQATHVALVFRQDQHTAFITYTDDGKGLKADAPFGNGLNNTVSRIKSLHGDIIFGKSEKAGVSIEMSFPLQPNNI